MPQHHADPTALVAAVRAGSSPHDRIAVWGSFPEVYWLSGRMPGGAFVLSDFLVGRNGALDDRVPRVHTPTPGALETFLKAMRADPPRLFLDTSTGHVRDYQYFPMSSVPRSRELRAAPLSPRRLCPRRDGVPVDGRGRGARRRRRVRPRVRRS